LNAWLNRAFLTSRCSLSSMRITTTASSMGRRDIHFCPHQNLGRWALHRSRNTASARRRAGLQRSRTSGAIELRKFPVFARTVMINNFLFVRYTERNR
jgi:hypothetical protein